MERIASKTLSYPLFDSGEAQRKELLLDKMFELAKRIHPAYYATYEKSEITGSSLSGLLEKYLGFVYIEEFRQGSYGRKGSFWTGKSTHVRIWFVAPTPGETTVVEREFLRDEIEQELVLPFIKGFNISGLFPCVDRWEWRIPEPVFCANEVSICIETDIRELSC